MSTTLADRAARGQFDGDVLEWIAAGMAAWKRGESIEAALKLDRARRIREHNAALRDAAAVIRQQIPGLSTWAVAGRLAKAIRHFETRIAPMLQVDHSRELSALDDAIHAAISTGHRGPRTQRKLFDLLN